LADDQDASYLANQSHHKITCINITHARMFQKGAEWDVPEVLFDLRPLHGVGKGWSRIAWSGGERGTSRRDNVVDDFHQPLGPGEEEAFTFFSACLQERTVAPISVNRSLAACQMPLRNKLLDITKNVV